MVGLNAGPKIVTENEPTTEADTEDIKLSPAVKAVKVKSPGGVPAAAVTFVAKVASAFIAETRPSLIPFKPGSVPKTVYVTFVPSIVTEY